MGMIASLKEKTAEKMEENKMNAQVWPMTEADIPQVSDLQYRSFNSVAVKHFISREVEHRTNKEFPSSIRQLNCWQDFGGNSPICTIDRTFKIAFGLFLKASRIT